MKKGEPKDGASASQRIDERIRELGGWRGEMLARVRARSTSARARRSTKRR
jgi:hypothetical protein